MSPPRLSALAVALLIPAALWALLFFIVPPGQQEFPANDDWAFARSAFALARGEGLHYYHWASMPLLGQLAWAAPFVWLLGESHVALRLSTLVLALLGVAAFHDLLRHEEKLERRQAVLTALCLALNPLFFLLAATFHSDVPALSFSLAALALYGRGLRGESIRAWMGGAAVALVAVSTRQNAIVVPLTAALLLARRPQLRRRPVWLAGSLLPLTVGIVVDAWFGQRDDVQRLAPDWTAIRTFPVLLYLAVHSLGLAALPLLVQRPVRGWKAFLLALVLMGGAAHFLAALNAPPHAGLFPYLGDWLTPWGQFGNQTVVAGERPLLFGPPTRWALTLLGCLAGAALVAVVNDRCGTGLTSRALPLFTLLHFPFLLIAPSVYDRYLLVLLPGALAVAAAPKTGRRGSLLGAAVLSVLGLFSFALLHDFLAWNAARWELGRRALASGIAPADIEGGFQWDGWYATHAVVEPKPRPPRGLTLPVNRRFFDHLTGRYALSFTELPGTRTRDAEPYRLWLIPGKHQFYLVELESSAASSP